MSLRATILILGLVWSFQAALGIRFVIDREECFSHKAEYEGDTLHVSFVVIKSDSQWHFNEDGVDLVIHGPTGEQIHDFREQISAKHDFVVQKKGVYRFCFTNKSPYHETIDFDVQLGHFAYYDQHAKDDSAMDNDGVCKRFILVDDNYKFFFDHHLSGGDNTFLPPFDDDNAESETRNLSLEFSSGGSNRSKLGGGNEKNPVENRVPQQQRKRRTSRSEAEISRATTTVRESIQRDNRAAERRKRKMAELESARVSRSQVNIQRDSKARKVSESRKVDTLRDVPLVRAQETIQRESKVNTLRNVPSVRAKEVIQQDNIAKKMSESESKVETLRDVPLVRSQETIQRDNKAKKVSESESKVDTLRDGPLLRTKEAVRRDNRIAERRKKKTVETTSRVVTEPTAVDDETVPVTVGTRKKVVDKDYMSYLTWLVDSLKDSTAVPVPTPPPQNQSTIPSGKDTESCSDDDDDDEMIMVYIYMHDG